MPDSALNLEAHHDYANEWHLRCMRDPSMARYGNACCYVPYFQHYRRRIYGVTVLPWRRVCDLNYSGKAKFQISEQGQRLLERYGRMIKPIVDARAKNHRRTDSECEELMKIYIKLWPFKGAKPDGLVENVNLRTHESRVLD